MTTFEQTQASNGAVPPALAGAMQTASEQHAHPVPSSYVRVIEDVDLEEMGRPYDFRLPKRVVDLQSTEELQTLAKRTWRMTNSQSLDWQELSKMEGPPSVLLKRLLGDEQYNEFEKIKGVSQALLNNIMKDYRKFFGLDDPGK